MAGEVILLGGLSLLRGFSDDVFSKCRNILSFRRFDYQSKTYEPLVAYREESIEGQTVLYVPRYFPSEFKRTPHVTVDYRCDGMSLPNIELNKGETFGWGEIDQESFIAEAVSETNKNTFGGFALAPCGSGKTKMGLEIIRRLGRTALIVTPRIFISRQWMQEAAKTFNIGGSPLIIGRCQGSKKESGNQFPVVAGVADTVMAMPPEFFDTFGLIVFDECQYLPAKKWLTILSRARCKYMIGLTAGLTRSDGLECMFRYLVGDVISRIDKVTLQPGDVQQITVPSSVEVGGNNQRIFVAKRCAADQARNKVVARIAAALYAGGRQIMVFSDLLDHLDILQSEIESLNVPSSDIGKFVGGTKEDEQKVAVKCRVTLSTYKMGQEALNCPWKDALITATPPPIAGLRQLYGRIARLDPGQNKPTPLVIDIIDPCRFLVERGKNRERMWEKEGLKVSHYVYD